VKRYAIYLFFISFFCTTSVFGQWNEDSLRKIIRTTKYDSLRVDAYLSLGENYYLNELDTALFYWKKAEVLAEKINYLLGRADAYNNLGYILNQSSKLEESLAYYHKALALDEETGNYGGMAFTLSNIGQMYIHKLKDGEKAMPYYRRGLSFAHQANDSAAIALVLLNIGYVHSKNEQLDSALFYYRKSTTIREKLNVMAEAATGYNNIAKLLYRKGEVDSAWVYLDKAITYQTLTKNWTDLQYTLNNVGLFLIDMGDHKKAREMYWKALGIAGKTKHPVGIRNTARLLSEHYEQLNQLDSALFYQKLFTAYKDSILNAQKTRAFADADAKYKTERKQREIEQLESDKKIANLKTKQADLKAEKETDLRNLIIVLSILVALIAALLFNRYQLRRKQKESELELNQLDTEQRLLRAQMNPHFLFNSMASIQSFISENQADLAESYLARFARLMRRILEQTRKHEIALDEEIETLNLYLELEQLRFGHRFDFAIHVDENISQEGILLPPMLTQPFIENSIQHGMSHKKEKGTIEVSFALKGELLVCTVADDGIGREKAAELNKKRKGHTSRAMEVTQDRMQKLSAQNPNAGIDIFDLPEGGTKVEVRIPVNFEL
jgi:hypothetical protein